MAVAGISLDKYWTMSHWERRPLFPEQVQYAAMDAVVLLRIASGAFGSFRGRDARSGQGLHAETDSSRQ